MGYRQDMIGRRKGVCEKLYKALTPRLDAFAANPLGVESDVTIKDLVALVKYTMELDLEISGMIRDDNLEEVYSTDEECQTEAQRLLDAIAKSCA